MRKLRLSLLVLACSILGFSLTSQAAVSKYPLWCDVTCGNGVVGGGPANTPADCVTLAIKICGNSTYWYTYGPY